eukprot:7177525-Prorocentrum_lima.AAC.1
MFFLNTNAVTCGCSALDVKANGLHTPGQNSLRLPLALVNVWLNVRQCWKYPAGAGTHTLRL